ncbi:MAG: DMT family transporter [Candidatus Hodarchaeota archaeon]
MAKNFLGLQITMELLFVITTFFWAITFFLIKESILIIPPFVFLSIRFIISSILIFPIFIIQYKKNPIQNRHYFTKGVIVGFFLWAFFAFQTIGLQYTSATVAAFLTAFNIILTPVIAAILFKSSIEKRLRISVLIAFIGVSFLSGVLEMDISNIRGDLELVGNSFIIFSVLAVVFHILTTEQFAPTIDPIILLFLQLITAGIMSAVFMVITGEFQLEYFSPLNWTTTIWITLIVTIFFATIFGYFVQTYYQSKKIISGSRVALILSIEPIFAAIIGMLFFSETLSLLGIIGAVLIFTATILSRPSDFNTNI